MCGIAGVHVKPNARGKIAVGHLMDNLLLGIESRGKDATGFMSVSFDNEIQLDKSAIPATEFVKLRKSLKGNPQTVIAHTRWATQGHQSMNENNHPVQYGTMFVTHNGVIYNDAELFRENDWERNAAVDTVAIPALLHEMCEGGDFKNAGKALEKLDGAMAIAAVDVTKKGTVLLARGYSSPLIILETKDMIVWASTMEAIRSAWGKVLGTPPAKERFKTVDEGQLFVITNGEMVMETFEIPEPNYASWGSYGSSWNYGSEYSGSGKGGKRGYWITENGHRTYVEMNDHEYAKAVPVVTLRDIEDVSHYLEWAEFEVETHHDVIEQVADEMMLEPPMVEWLLTLADEKVIDLSVAMTVVHSKCEALYEEFHAKVSAQWAEPETKKDEPPFVTQEPSSKAVARLYDCIDCGAKTDAVYRCSICMVENANNPTLEDYSNAVQRSLNV